MTEKQFKYYLEKAVRSYNDGKKPNWGKEEEIWKIRDKAYDYMIDDIFKERVRKKYQKLREKCCKQLFAQKTPEEWKEINESQEKKVAFVAQVDILAKERLLSYLLDK